MRHAVRQYEGDGAVGRVVRRNWRHTAFRAVAGGCLSAALRLAEPRAPMRAQAQLGPCIGVFGVTVLVELDGLELVGTRLARVLRTAAVSSRASAGRAYGCHAALRCSVADCGSCTRQSMSAPSPGRCSEGSSR